MNHIRKLAHYGIAVSIPAVTSFAGYAVFTRMLTPHEYGTYALVLGMVTVTAELSYQWMVQSIARFVPGISMQEWRQWIRALWTALAFTFLLVICVALIVAMLAQSPFSVYILPSAILVLLLIITNVSGAVLQSRFNSRLYSRMQLLINASKFILSILFIVIFARRGVSLIWAAVVSTSFAIVPLLKSTGMFEVESRVRTVNSRRYLKSALLYGLPMMIWFVASNILSIADRYVISIDKGSVDAGIYFANYSLASNVITLFTSPILLLAHPLLMLTWRRDGALTTGRLLGKISSLVISCSLIVVVAVALFYKSLSHLLGGSFRTGSVILPIVTLGVGTMAYSYYAHKPFELKEHPISMMWIALSTAICNLVLNIAFVPRYGYYGAAWITAVSYLLYATLTTILGRRLVQWNLESGKLISLSVGLVTIYFAVRLVLDGLGDSVTTMTFLISFVTYVATTVFLLLLIYRKDVIGWYRGRRASGDVIP